MKLILIFLILITNAMAKDLKFAGQDYPPFNWVENGKTVGAMAEILTSACAITKDTCTLEIWPLKRALVALESGELQGVTSLLKNSDRDGFGNFVPGLIKSDTFYITTSDKPDFKTVAELKGWTIGAVKGASSTKIAGTDMKNIGGDGKVVEDDNNETMLKKLSGGRYGDKGAGIINEDVFSYLTKKLGITNLKKLFSAKSDDFGMYLSKKSVDQGTHDKLIAAIEELKKNGEYKKILTKYHFQN